MRTRPHSAGTNFRIDVWPESVTNRVSPRREVVSLDSRRHRPVVAALIVSAAMSPGLFQLLFLGCFLIGLLFFVRFLCAPFSEEIRAQMSKHRLLHWVWGGFALLTAFVLFVLLNPSAWPPAWWERRVQRERVVQRVLSAGGWDSLKRDCVALPEQHKSEPAWQWYAGDTNALPAAIAALQPQRVEYYPPKQWPHFNDSDFPVVWITIFGAHSTGGHDIPWLGLDVVCDRAGTDYQTHRQRSETPLKYWRYRKVADDVFEFF